MPQLCMRKNLSIVVLARKLGKKIIHDPKSCWNYLALSLSGIIDSDFNSAWPRISVVQGWLTKKEAYLLFQVARICTPGSSIVEIGSYKGRSTTALASGVQEGVTIFAIDPHTGDKTEVEDGQLINTFPEFLNNVREYESVVPIRKLSVNAVKEVRNRTQSIELLFIDGWHSEEAVNEDINSWVPLCSPQFTVIFDDWHQPEVRRGIIKNLEKLPPVLGVVGKDLVFSNHARLRAKFLSKIIRWTTASRVFQSFG